MMHCLYQPTHKLAVLVMSFLYAGLTIQRSLAFSRLTASSSSSSSFRLNNINIRQRQQQHQTTLLRTMSSTNINSSNNSNGNNGNAPRLPISSRTLTTLDPCVILMKQIISQHASKWEDDERGIFSLAQGVVHWRPPSTVYEALSRAVQANMMDDTDSGNGGMAYGMDGAVGSSDGDGRVIHTYCPDEGYPPLVSALKDKLQRENGLSNPHVMVTSGANQAYVNCVLTLLDENDVMGNSSKCVVFEPYYFNHVMAVQCARGGNGCGGTAAAAASASGDSGGIGIDAKSIEGLLVGPTNHGVPDLDWLRAQLEKNQYNDNQSSVGGGGGGNAIRMVTLVNPGNPTGVSLPYTFLEEITQLTKEYGVWLIMDNTYEHFDVKKKNKRQSKATATATATSSHDDDDNDDVNDQGVEYPCFDEEHVINIFSFSKGYAMAGFRVGYVALSSKTNNNGHQQVEEEEVGRGTQAYEEMLKVQDTIAICTSRISQMAALGALEAGRDWVYDQVKTLEVGREAILGAMSSLEEVIGGDGAMYVMGKLPDGVDDQKFASSLVEHYGVAVIPGSFCGLPGWIRVCYSNLPPEDCKIAATRLKKGIIKLTEN